MTETQLLDIVSSFPRGPRMKIRCSQQFAEAYTAALSATKIKENKTMLVLAEPDEKILLSYQLGKAVIGAPRVIEVIDNNGPMQQSLRGLKGTEPIVFESIENNQMKTGKEARRLRREIERKRNT